MAADDTTRYGDLCRLCATKTNMILGINIFENEGAIRQINKKIEICLPIQVHETDELPKMICENCVYKLELFYDFRERSLKTEGLLIELFKELSATKLHNTLNKISQPLNVNLNHTDIILVQHNDLLNQQSLQGVPDIDLSQLDHRHNIITEQEIILNQQNANISAHALNGIVLNHHDLTGHELSNHSLGGQEGMIVSTSTDVHMLHHPRYMEDSLNLIHHEHQLMAEQYNLQQDVHLHNTDNSHSITDVTSHSELHSATDNTPEENVFDHSKTDCNNQTSIQRVTDMENCTNASYKNESNRQNHSNNDECIDTTATQHDSISCSINKTSQLTQKRIDCKEELKMCDDEQLSECSICLESFVNEQALKLHIEQMHRPNESSMTIKTRLKRATLPVKKDDSTESDNEDSKMLKDDMDDEDDPYSAGEMAPLNTAKRKKWFPKVCTECGKSYKTNYKLMEHMRKHTGEKPYKCSSCEKAFRSKIGLAQHEAKHTGQYDLSCPTCGKGFQCKSYLMVHQRVHSDIKPYPCTTCGRQFKTKQSLLDHTNRHLGVKPYMCDVCGRGFITKGLCRAHQKTHFGMDNRKFSCSVCNKMFVSKSYLQTHLRIHTGEKPFVCEVCSKGFLTRVDLRIHSTMHTGEKSYVCETCGKAFARRDALRCHRRSHTGERPYSCEVCGQTFTQFSPMAIHKRLHTGERPYPCEICGKKFVSRSTMMSHYKKHNK